MFGISGGSLQTRSAVRLLDTGTFSVLGSGATSIGIGSTGTLDGAWSQRAGGTLSAQIDANGVTPIFIDDVDGNETIFAEFQNGALLDLGFHNVAPFEGTWTVLEAENTNITDLGLTLTATTLANPGWSFAVDNSGANGLLTATFTASSIPEPSSLALLGLSGLMLAGRRRR